MVQCVVVLSSILQRVATWCSVLQGVTMCFSVLQYAAVCCSVLRCVAVRCSVLQCTCSIASHSPSMLACAASTANFHAACVLQCVAVRFSTRALFLICYPAYIPAHRKKLQHTAHNATMSNTLQAFAKRCNILQHTAAHCNTLQHTAAHCNALRQS